jgi:predicted nucleic acid-binding protein
VGEGEEKKMSIVIEASPLISFLKIDRFDLLEVFPKPLVCTAHVRDEVSQFKQKDQLDALITTGRISEVDIYLPEQLAEFAHVIHNTPLGPGEVSSILFAQYTRDTLIITDHKAVKEAKRRAIPCLTTQDVVVRCITAGLLSLDEADDLIQLWHSVREGAVTVTSFRQLLSKSAS